MAETVGGSLRGFVDEWREAGAAGRRTALLRSIPERLRASLRESFGNVPGAFRLVREADPAGTRRMALLTLAGAALPASQAWIAKLIVDSVVRASREGLSVGRGLREVLPYLLAEFGLILAGALVSQFRRLTEEILDHRLGHLINSKIIRKALELDLHHFENAEFYDRMQKARKQSEYRALAIINSGFLLAQNIATLASFLAILVAFRPLIAFVLFGAAIPAFVVQSRYGRLNFRLQSWRTPETRRLSYLEHVLTVDGSAKEIKLFNLGEPLLKRYDTLFWKIFDEDRRLAVRRSWASFGWGLVAALAYYGAYGWIIADAIAGTITLGALTMYLAVFRGSQGAFEGLFENIGRLYENGLFMQNLFGFLGLKGQEHSTDAGRATASQGGARRAEPDLSRGIEFERVSFRYASGAWALRDVSLTIAPGEKLAIVGANGAGKTTLIKLLTRLYDPTEGTIRLNGIDLRDYDLADLRRKIGVIFQDFVRYQVTVGENVGFGSVEHLDDSGRVERAARKGGADEVAAGLPQGLGTMLGGWFEKGQELSGGQWQKVALSRAFMRESEVLVLDEPTSALDPEKEYEIFQRFRELTDGKIAMLISHRFSTVRMADRIAVLHEGRLIELGSHRELMDRSGRYARLFSLQAEGYR